MVNVNDLIDLCAELAVLRYFPSEPAARLAIARLVGALVSDLDQARWLIARMTSGIYAEWPGPQEMRACFCNRYKPKDGINAYSTVYLDGIPSERPALAAAPQKALPAGGKMAKDTRMDAAVNIFQRTIALKDRGISGPATKAEIASAPEWLRRLEGYE